MTTSEDTRTSLQRRTVLLAAISAIGLAAAKVEAAGSDIVRLDVIDRETGQAARVWRHAGRLFVSGRPGARYSLRVTNTSPGRVLVVMSVDGINILTGETAAYGQRGYIFRPYESYEVSGWRKSDTQVAAFTFAPLPRSYAAQTGRPGDVGVIGIAAFTERPPPRPVASMAAPEVRAKPADRDEPVVRGMRIAPPPAISIPQSAPAAAADRAGPSREMAQRSEKLGTEHGAREYSAVTTVAFERATSYPQLIHRLEYDSYDNLVANGVIPRPRPIPPRPRPFPASPDGGGYVPDPPYGR